VAVVDEEAVDEEAVDEAAEVCVVELHAPTSKTTRISAAPPAR
jgi:hypothetical protein